MRPSAGVSRPFARCGAGAAEGCSKPDFSLTFSPKPDWDALLLEDAAGELERKMQLATEADNSQRVTIGFIGPQRAFGLSIRLHAPTRFRRSLVQILKRAAD
jgi:hypothetical protein